MNEEKKNKIEKIILELELIISELPLNTNDNDSLKLRIKINDLFNELKNTLSNIKNEDQKITSLYKTQKQYLDGTGPYYIDGKNNFTGTKLSSFEFLGERIEVYNWKELYIKMCELFYEKNNRDFVRIALDAQFETFLKNPTFSKDANSVIKPHKIGNFYMGTNYSADDITKIIRGFMQSLNYKTEDLKIFLLERSNE